MYTKSLTSSITSKNFLKLDQVVYDNIEKRTTYVNTLINVSNLSIINRKGLKHSIELCSNERIIASISGKEEENTEAFYDQIVALL